MFYKQFTSVIIKMLSWSLMALCYKRLPFTAVCGPVRVCVRTFSKVQISATEHHYVIWAYYFMTVFRINVCLRTAAGTSLNTTWRGWQVSWEGATSVRCLYHMRIHSCSGGWSVSWLINQSNITSMRTTLLSYGINTAYHMATSPPVCSLL